jgi:hypothetical protein
LTQLGFRLRNEEGSHFSLNEQAQQHMSPTTRKLIRFLVAALLITGAVIYGRLHQGHERRTGPAQNFSCLNNHKQIGIAFKTWALDHEDQFPCNISTNAGGTLEFCTIGRDGFDNDAALHFRPLSNELSTTVLLVCPKDGSKIRASDFSTLQAANVTYRLRSGTNISGAHPKEVLAFCPVDGNTLYCDASVKEGQKH